VYLDVISSSILLWRSDRVIDDLGAPNFLSEHHVAALWARVDSHGFQAQDVDAFRGPVGRSRYK